MRDAFHIFSDAQLLTVSVQATNNLDLESALHGLGNSCHGIILNIACHDDFAGGTSLVCALYDSADDTTYLTTGIATPAILLASLTAGAMLFKGGLPIYSGALAPGVLRRYISVYYTIVGPMTGDTSRINAWLDVY